MKNKLFPIFFVVVLVTGLFLPTIHTQARVLPPTTPPKVIFFVADGMRQDKLPEYFSRGLPTDLQQEFAIGAMATDNGLLTQAPPNTGAGWYTLMTGAWAGVHGSTNNTFYKPNVPFSSGRVAAFDPGVLQAESLAQSAERGGKKVIQFEFAGGRNAMIAGPTVDYRNFFSGRGVATNYISPSDDAAFVAAFGLQFDHPAGFAGQAAFPEAAPTAADQAWVNTPPSYSPAMQMRMRVLDFGVDKYGLYAYIFDSSDDGVVNYDKVMFSPVLDGSAAVATLAKGEWADVKVQIVGGNYAGKTAGFWVKVEELTPELSQVRLFHTSAARAIAVWAGFPGQAGYTDFEEYLAAAYPSSTAADYAILEAGIVSEDTYVEQGLSWDKFAHPVLEYLLTTYQPDLAMVGYPTIDEFQHQFMGLVTPTLPNGEANPAYDDVMVDGTKDNLVVKREGYLAAAYRGAAETYVTVRRFMPQGNINTFVSSDHGFGAQFLAIDASQVLVNLGLLSKPQTSNCRLATGETIGTAKACWAGGTVQIYWAKAPTQAELDLVKNAFLNLSDPNDWNHDGQPESWKMIDRVFTKAEARYIPNGPDSTADMAHPTRTGDLVVFAYPPYQFDAATPGTLVALSHFFGQHGYVPDVQILDANINMRATFLAAGRTIVPSSKVTARSIDLAPTIAYILGVPAPQQSQGRPLTEILLDGPSLTSVNFMNYTDYHGQLDPTTVSIDGVNINVGGSAYLATLFDENAAKLPGQTLLFADGDNVGASPPNSGLLEDMPTIDVMNAWGVTASTFGNHEFDYGLGRLAQQQAVSNNSWLAVNIVDEATGQLVSWAKPSEVFVINGVKVGVIGAALEVTPELVKPTNVAGLKFLPAAPAVMAESQRLESMGVKVQVVLVHEGSANGQNAIDGVAGVLWDGPAITLANELQGTTVDVIAGGHTHRVTNTMVGHIQVVQNQNAGKDFTVTQMLVANGDVVWTGAATQLAKVVGVAQRPDVKAIVDQANLDTAPLRNLVIGTQQFDILRDPSRLNESAMANMVADALRWYYPQVDIAYTNSGGLRADLVCSPPSASEQNCEITWGEMFAVLPFGNSTFILDLTGAQLETALLNGFSPKCNPAISTGRFPAVSGLKVNFHCVTATKTPVVDSMLLTPSGPGGVEIPILPTDVVTIVTNDFMYYGGDGYTVFSQGTNVKATGDLMLDTAISNVTAFSPVGPTVDGRLFYGGALSPEMFLFNSLFNRFLPIIR